MKMKNNSHVEKSKVKNRSFRAENLPMAVNPIDSKKSIWKWGGYLFFWGILFVLFLFPLWKTEPASSRYLTRKNSVILEVAVWNSHQAREAILRQAEIYLTDHSSPSFEKIVLNGLRNLSLNFTKSEIQPFYMRSHFSEHWQTLVRDHSQPINECLASPLSVNKKTVSSNSHPNTNPSQNIDNSSQCHDQNFYEKNSNRSPNIDNNSPVENFTSENSKKDILTKDITAKDITEKDILEKDITEKDILENSSLNAVTLPQNDDLSFTRQVLEELTRNNNEGDVRELLAAKEFLNLFDHTPLASSNSPTESHSDFQSDRVSNRLQFLDDCWFAIDFSSKQEESFYRNPLDRIAFYAPEEIFTVNSGTIFQMKTVSPWGIFTAFLLLVFSVPGTLPVDNLFGWLMAPERKIGLLRKLKLSGNFRFPLTKYSFRISASSSSFLWADIQRLLI